MLHFIIHVVIFQRLDKYIETLNILGNWKCLAHLFDKSMSNLALACVVCRRVGALKSLSSSGLHRLVRQGKVCRPYAYTVGSVSTGQLGFCFCAILGFSFIRSGYWMLPFTWKNKTIILILLRSCCGSVDKITDSQPWGPWFESAGSGCSALGQGTLSSLPSHSERT